MLETLLIHHWAFLNNIQKALQLIGFFPLKLLILCMLPKYLNYRVNPKVNISKSMPL